MKNNVDRILVSHAGNLPRPDDVNQLLDAGKGKSDEREISTHHVDPLFSR